MALAGRWNGDLGRGDRNAWFRLGAADEEVEEKDEEGRDAVGRGTEDIGFLCGDMATR